MALFEGNQSSYGTHGLPVYDHTTGKAAIKTTAKTVLGPTTPELWKKHLDGKTPLGIAPIQDDEQGLCKWGSIDVDEYDGDLDPLEIIKRIEDSKLPLVVCRSKSGGLHLFIFFRKPVPAAILQAYLRDVAASIGFAKSEIFPKQTKLMVSRGERGSWMVMPYYGDTYKNLLKWQHGIKRTGADMTVVEFCTACEEAAIDPAVLTAPKAKKASKVRSPFSDGPPCLEHLAAAGIAQGGQNNALFHMGVYFKKASPESWKERLEEANQKYCKPPHPSDGVAGVIKSLDRRDYQYKCKDQPMESHCDAVKCRIRKHGVGAAGTYPHITTMSKMATEPAIFFVSLDGETESIQCDSRQLHNYDDFHRLCIENLNKSFMPLTKKEWFAVLNDALINCTPIPVPPDIQIGGRFKELLHEYLTNRQRGESREDLLSGRPWEDEEEGRHYFRLNSFEKFLEREGVKDLKQGQITVRIKRLGGEAGQQHIKGSCIYCWWVPSKSFKEGPDIPPPKIKESKI